jgi:hypothetical protein
MARVVLPMRSTSWDAGPRQYPQAFTTLWQNSVGLIFGGSQIAEMESSAILHELTHAEGLPREALKAAADRRSEIAPILIRELEAYLASPAADRKRPTPLFFSFHLFGDWKEKAAYRPLARLLRCPRNELDAQIGDGLVETAHRVMVAVFDGDPKPIFEIILDPEAEEFVRSRMCEALAMLVLRGEADRAAVTKFLRDCFMNVVPQSECYVWVGWQSAIAMLGLSELKLLVRKAFDRGLVDPQCLSFSDFEEDLQRGINQPGVPRFNDNQYAPFGNIIDELSTWYCFSDKFKEDQARRKQRAEEQKFAYPQPEPVINPFKNVGRNDPCPCGSGKKYKKCCLH